MKKCLASLAAIAFLVVASSAWAAPSVVGKWRAHQMKARGETKDVPPEFSVVIEFTKGGVFSATMEAKMPDGKSQKKVEKGTYKVKGKTLITTAKKEEKMTFAVKGDTLTLTKVDKDESMILKRVP
jgi:uncharacterized protein (TIGR03066 family)